MARRYILRFDLWICLSLAFLISLGTKAIVTNIRTAQYEQHKAEHVVEGPDIGGFATEDTFRAQNIADLESHDTFTVISPGIEYQNRGGGYYRDMYLNALRLPSGEIVAARINSKYAAKIDPTSDYFSGETILPIGHLVSANLEDNPTFLSQIEFKEPLSTHAFYIDMVGNGAIANQDDFIEAPVLFAQLITVIIVFTILHYAGSKIGIFPAFYTRRETTSFAKSTSNDAKSSHQTTTSSSATSKSNPETNSDLGAKVN